MAGRVQVNGSNANGNTASPSVASLLLYIPSSAPAVATASKALGPFHCHSLFLGGVWSGKCGGSFGFAKGDIHIPQDLYTTKAGGIRSFSCTVINGFVSHVSLHTYPLDENASCAGTHTSLLNLKPSTQHAQYEPPLFRGLCKTSNHASDLVPS